MNMKKFIFASFLLATSCFGQSILRAPDANSVLLTNTTYVAIITNVANGVLPVNFSIKNLGAGVAEVRHTNTNDIGYILNSGDVLNIGYWTRISTNWYGRLIGSTNATLRIIRENQK